mmetsp:Transcript_24414/g.56878  ORF Transcript_24414/g.56878 Transcript_24414/m.56878 type:complete len:140 (-) Transcript_24414:250-669(-)
MNTGHSLGHTGVYKADNNRHCRISSTHHAKRNKAQRNYENRLESVENCQRVPVGNEGLSAMDYQQAKNTFWENDVDPVSPLARLCWVSLLPAFVSEPQQRHMPVIAGAHQSENLLANCGSARPAPITRPPPPSHVGSSL